MIDSKLYNVGARVMKSEEEMVEETSPRISYIPKTALGKKLLLIREKMIAAGESLLDWDEIQNEIDDRRGGHQNNAL